MTVLLQAPWETLGQDLLKLNSSVPYNPAVSVPGVTLREMGIYVPHNAWIRMFTVIFLSLKAGSSPGPHQQENWWTTVVKLHMGILQNNEQYYHSGNMNESHRHNNA